MCIIIVFYLFQTLDNLVGVIHTLRVVEHRGILRDVDNHIVTLLLGVLVDSLEDTLLDGLNQLQALFHQLALGAEERLLELGRLLLLAQDVLLVSLLRSHSVATTFA